MDSTISRTLPANLCTVRAAALACLLLHTRIIGDRIRERRIATGQDRPTFEFSFDKEVQPFRYSEILRFVDFVAVGLSAEHHVEELILDLRFIREFGRIAHLGMDWGMRNIDPFSLELPDSDRRALRAISQVVRMFGPDRLIAVLFRDTSSKQEHRQ